MTSITRSSRRVAVAIAVSAAGLLAVSGIAGAQASKPASRTAKTAKSVAQPPAKALAGQWAGTVTVKLGDSTIVAPVFYTFVDSAGATTGTAMVPGQGTGPISNYARTGDTIRFRVTAKQAEKLRLLEHEGKLDAGGALEGMVTLENKPVAKFRIAPKK